MNRKVRSGVFETNSSSTHSISISLDTGDKLEEKMFATIVPNSDGFILLAGGEFGWECETYSDALTKANYCAVDQRGSEANMNMLKEVIKEQTGAKKVVIDFASEGADDDDYSYIDHQSSGTAREAFQDKETLRRFIFDKKSVLTTDNDNH